ncbi:MAG: glucosamine-6-phosphate deaminase [Candidatus Berkelbacteria bacterium]|nr:glucosamine-6-phosphate deaminase [Candidatus Berkelbacteria bacterium]
MLKRNDIRAKIYLMKILVFKKFSDLVETAGQKIKEAINQKPDLRLALPTGKTLILLYRKLIELNKKGQIDFSRVITFNLDEYLGLGLEDKNSFRHYLENNFLKHVNIQKKNQHFLDGLSSDQEITCQKYENKIKKLNGFDLCLLGIGKNGHIAFNEPGSDFNSRTRMVELTSETIKVNAFCPVEALTVGIGTITDSKDIFLLANKNKNKILKKAIYNKITRDTPASILQDHQKTTIFMIEED